MPTGNALVGLVVAVVGLVWFGSVPVTALTGKVTFLLEVVDLIDSWFDRLVAWEFFRIEGCFDHSELPLSEEVTNFCHSG